MAYEPHAAYLLGDPRVFPQGLDSSVTYRIHVMDAKKYSGRLKYEVPC